MSESCQLALEIYEGGNRELVFDACELVIQSYLPVWKLVSVESIKALEDEICIMSATSKSLWLMASVVL